MVATLIPPREPEHGPGCDADLRQDGCVCVEKATVTVVVYPLPTYTKEELEEHARRITRDLMEQMARKRRENGDTARELRALFGGR